jgi:hypothetical protein
MKGFLSILLGSILFLQCGAALAEEVNTGITITSASGSIGEYQKPSFSVKAAGSSLLVSITDFFYNEGAFDQPWITLESGRKATLHIGTKKKFSLFQNKGEYIRSLSLEIARSKATKGTTLYIFNEDTGETLGHTVLP